MERYDDAPNGLQANAGHDQRVEEDPPFFYAEAMSPAMRVGVLAGSLFSAGLIAFIMVAPAIWADGVLAFGTLFAIETVGIALAQAFVMVLVYGGLLGKNEQLSSRERVMWYGAFLFPGPFAMPLYWIMYVRSAPYLYSPKNADKPSPKPLPRLTALPLSSARM